MSVTDLYLVRHAQAIVNLSGVLAGPKGDTGLTELGVQQAEALRDRLKTSGEIKPDTFLASSLPRARQTAEIIAPAFGVQPTLEDDLQEFRVGPDADGLALEEYKARFGWLDFEEDPFTETDPGAESWALFQVRVARTLTRIVREHAGKVIVCVTHGGVVDGAFGYFFGLSPHVPPRVRLYTENASLTRWQYHEGRWRLVFYNDTHHLKNLLESR
ncbi:MAG: histidine phosphatase family protein [Armatimonas sp.]